MLVPSADDEVEKAEVHQFLSWKTRRFQSCLIDIQKIPFDIMNAYDPLILFKKATVFQFTSFQCFLSVGEFCYIPSNGVDQTRFKLRSTGPFYPLNIARFNNISIGEIQ